MQTANLKPTGENSMASNYYRDLKQALVSQMNLPELINAFERVVSSAEGLEENELLFETGNYDFNGPKQLYFSLTLQWPNNEDDEYVQLRMDILFPQMDIGSEEGNSMWSWEYDSYAIFFDAVRESLTFNKLVDDGIEVQQVMVLEEET